MSIQATQFSPTAYALDKAEEFFAIDKTDGVLLQATKIISSTLTKVALAVAGVVEIVALVVLLMIAFPFINDITYHSLQNRIELAERSIIAVSEWELRSDEATDKTHSLWPNEKYILKAAGLGDLIKNDDIFLDDMTLKKIENRLSYIDAYISSQYFSSYGNRVNYWLGYGDINKHLTLKKDLKIVLTKLQDPKRIENDLGTAISGLFALFLFPPLGLLFLAPNSYSGTYTEDQITPFNQEFKCDILP